MWRMGGGAGARQNKDIGSGAESDASLRHLKILLSMTKQLDFTSGPITSLIITCSGGKRHMDEALPIGLLLKPLKFKWTKLLCVMLVI